MDIALLQRESDYASRIEPRGDMRVPGVIYADEALVRAMDEKVYEQVRNVATLPGIVRASYAMPDAHWGYGFPIGGVAAFDPDEGGVVSAGGVGFDISCGVRSLHTGLKREDVEAVKMQLADTLYRDIPAGMSSTRCSKEAPGGPSSKATASRLISSGSRSADGCAARRPSRFQSAPNIGSVTRWARWARATTICIGVPTNGRSQISPYAQSDVPRRSS
jgi:hypothetical protein